MRIAVWHNFGSGGGKRALHDHVRGLVERGHHVEAWCPTTANPDYMPLSRYCVEHVVPLEVPPTPSARPFGELTRPYREAVGSIEAMEAHCRACGEQIRQGGFDLLFANSCFLTAASPIARHVDIPSVLYLQEPYRFFYEAQAWPDATRLSWTTHSDMPVKIDVRGHLATPAGWGKLRGLLRWLAVDLASAHGYRMRAREEALGVHAHRRVLCNSYFSRESMARTYGIDAKVCYLGIDTDAFWPGGRKRSYVVGLGAVNPNKRVEEALRSLATIDAERRPGLVWIGNIADAAYQERMAALATSLGVDLSVRRMIPQAELVEVLGSAAAMIYTPLLEPFGYAPLEANACGTAVVGWAEGGLRETIRDGVNGVVVEPGDHEATGRALLRYVEDLDLARDEGLRARRHVEENWALSPSIDRLEGHLRGALERGPSRGLGPVPSPSGGRAAPV